MDGQKVEIADPGRMHLVGHFLRAVIAGRVEAGARVPRGLIAVRAGGMTLTLSGDGRRVRLDLGASPEASAVVSGSPDTLLGVALGRGVVAAVATGRLRVGGNPFALLRWLPLLRVGPKPEGRS